MTDRDESTRSRADRIANRARNPRWAPPALHIDMSLCINCDACLRACPPQFGAIFNHGIDVIIIPELCSGCAKCLPVCPVDCILEIAGEPTSTPGTWWDEPNSANDPYVSS